MNPANRIREKRTHLLRAEEKMEELMQLILRRKRHALDLYIERMNGLSPLQKLSSGYSYVVNGEGKNIRSVQAVSPGEEIRIHVTDGHITALVKGVKEYEIRR